MHGRILPPGCGGDSGRGPRLWPSSAETPAPSHSLRRGPPNALVSYSPDNTAACVRNFGNPATPPRSGSTRSLSISCVGSRRPTPCLPDKRKRRVRRRRRRRWAEVGSGYSFCWAHFPTPCCPENQSRVPPSVRCCLGSCSRHRPPSVAALSPTVPRCAPPLAATVRSRWRPALPPHPRSVHAPRRWKSARCSSAIIPHRSGASLALADLSCSHARRSWPSPRPCVPATSATLPARSPAALVVRAAREPALALLSDYSLRFADRPSPPRAAAPAPDAPESFLPVDNSACSPML